MNLVYCLHNPFCIVVQFWRGYSGMGWCMIFDHGNARKLKLMGVFYHLWINRCDK